MRQIITVVLVIVLGSGCNCFRYTWIKMSTSTMEPTIHLGAKVLIDKEMSKYTPQRFDIVLISWREKDINGKTLPEWLIIKRIIGLPGEEVLLNNGKVSINGKVEQEPFTIIPDTRPNYYKKIIVPPDSVFVLGDNRPASLDSRHLGIVPIKNIIAAAVVANRHP